MFERFTDRARRTVVLAQEEARLLDHNYIGTEHLLLGLVGEREGLGALVLADLGVDLASLRTSVEEFIGRGQKSPSSHIPFTPRAKKVFELALRESLQLGHNYIGTEHILLGLIREGAGVAAQILVTGYRLDLSDIRKGVIYRVTGATGPVPAPTPPPPTTMSIELSDDVVVAFLAWADEFSRVNGPLAGKHPMVLVRKALKARTRP